MRVVVVQIVQQSVSKVLDKPLVQPGVQAVCTLIELIQPLKEVGAILLNVYIPVGKEVFVLAGLSHAVSEGASQFSPYSAQSRCYGPVGRRVRPAHP